MVRMHRFVKDPDMAWVTGVLFERDETQVLVQATTNGNEIVLRARGLEHKALLSVIASDLDALNASFSGLQGKLGKWIPCACTRCKGSASPEFFEQKRLLQRKRDNRLIIECPTSYQDVSVLELLEGLKLDQFPKWSKETAEESPNLLDSGPSRSAAPGKTTKIFLASSEELREDRDAFDLYVRQQNDLLLKKWQYLKIVRWENFLDVMSESRLQEEYNREVRACDIFVSLFATKTGKYTEEEFDVAYGVFKDHKEKPQIYTFFKSALISTDRKNEANLKSLWDFQGKLQSLGHFWTNYDDIEHLKRQFRDQLDKLFDQGKI